MEFYGYYVYDVFFPKNEVQLLRFDDDEISLLRQMGGLTGLSRLGVTGDRGGDPVKCRLTSRHTTANKE